LGEINAITASVVFLAVKALNAGKAAGCNGMLKALKEIIKVLKRVLWPTFACQAAWYSRRAQKRETGVNALNTEHPLLSLL